MRLSEKIRWNVICSALAPEVPMRARSVVLGILALLLSTFVAVESRAEAPSVEKIVALNKAAISAFGAGDHEKAKSQLMEAVVLGKENGLGMHAAMARTYLHLGVVYVDGFKDKEKGQRYFTMAQKVRSDIELTPSLASPSVKAAFDAARGESGAKAETAKVEAKAEAPRPEVAAVEEKKETKAEAKAREKAEKAARDEEARAAKATDKASRIIDDSKTARFEEKITALESELRKHEQEARNREQQLRDEKEKLQRELAQARDSEKQQRAEVSRLQAEERKLQVQIAERDKKLGLKDGEVAEAKAEAKRERDARQNVEKQDKEKAKLIADVTEREKKQREATEKLEKERQLAEARDKERKERDAQEKAAREKLAEGPELPSNIPQPLYCGNKDEGVLGADLYIHCVPQGQVKAKSLVLYYRTTGNAHFDAATMSHTRKGWWVATVPASRVTGKSLQYYAEARGPRDEVAAHNGKPDSPNILALRSAEAIAKKSGSSDPLVDLMPSKSSSKAAAKTSTKAAKTAAAKRTKARR
jgi:hypothetical protein